MTEQRYRFVEDNDGHNYMIPAEKDLVSFYHWVDAMENDKDWDGFDFNNCRIDAISSVTFEKPIDSEAD